MFLLLLLAGILGTRLAWTLTTSATGWRPCLDQWAKAAGGFAGIERPALSDQAPEEQAEFWLHEVESVDRADDDPILAMGAAWMLDAPQYAFVRHHLRKNENFDFPGMPAGAGWEPDYEAIGALCDDFESLCREECLAKIEKATRLDESNVELWRARALLLFRTMEFTDTGEEPRRDDWLAVLDECAKHDPENALYDYLAALCLWTSSAEYEWEEDGYVLKVEDAEGFERGNARFASGLTKPCLKSGMEGYAATLAFLEETSVAKTDHANIAGSRQIAARVNNLAYQLMRWQSAQRDVKKRNREFEAAVVFLRNVLRISDQVTESGNHADLSLPKLTLRHWSLANLEDMQKDHPDLLSADEAKRVSEELATIPLDLKILQESFVRLRKKAGTLISTDASSGSTMMFPKRLPAVPVMVAAQTLVIATIAMAAVLWLGGSLFGAPGGDEPVTMGWWRHIIAWTAGLGLSLALLGIESNEPLGAMVLEQSKSTWAFIQWQAHHGAIVASLTAVGILLIWHTLRRARRLEGGLRRILASEKRIQIRRAGNVAAKSCAVAALLFFLVYLAAAPTFVDVADTYYEVHCNRLANPAGTWKEMKEVDRQIRSDESVMAKLNAKVEEDKRQLVEQEAWQGEQPKTPE